MPKVNVLLRLTGLTLDDEFIAKLRDSEDEEAFEELECCILDCLTQPGLRQPDVAMTSVNCDEVTIEDVEDWQGPEPGVKS